MRVLVVHNKYQQRGGEDAVVDAEVDLLSRKGHDVELLSVSNDRIAGFIPTIKAALGTVYSPYGVGLVSEAIAKFSPDIMHVHNYFPRLSPYIFARAHRLGVPTVHTLHNYRLICPSADFLVEGKVDESSIHRSAFRMIQKRVYRNSILGTASVAAMVEYHKKRGTWMSDVDAFITLTNFAKRKFIEAGLPEILLHVKPNFIMEDRIRRFGNRARQSAREGAIFVGRLSPEKGIDTLLSAWHGIDYELRIIGPGATRRMRSLASEKIRFLGELPPERVMEEMGKAAFIVMPSECYEGFPVTLAEAYMNELPVVASDIGGLGELVTSETGIKCRPGDHNALAAAVNRMIALGADGRSKLGDNARRIALENYSEHKNYNILTDIYERAIHQYERRRANDG